MNEYELKYKLLMGFIKSILESDDTTYATLDKIKSVFNNIKLNFFVFFEKM